MSKELYNKLVGGTISLGRDRYDNVIHASNLINFCPREYALCQLEGGYYNANGRETHPSGAMVFHIGDAIHEVMRKILEAAGVLVMNECRMEYLYKGKIKVVGTCDNIIRDGNTLRIIDVKSISTKGVESLIGSKYAKDEHIQQVRVYLWLAEKLGYKKIDQDLGYVIYVPKEKYKYPFLIRDANYSETMKMEFEQQLDQLVEFVDNKILPERVCAHKKCNMAKACRRVESCFNRVEDTILLIGGADDIIETAPEPAERKGKPKGSRKDDTRVTEHRDAGRRRRVPSRLITREQVREALRRDELVYTSGDEQQTESRTRRTRSRDRKES